MGGFCTGAMVAAATMVIVICPARSHAQSTPLDIAKQLHNPLSNLRAHKGVHKGVGDN